jgi:DNA-binding MarR family transcriptional regulator
MGAQTWTLPKAGGELRRLVADGDAAGVHELLEGLYVDAVTMCTENDLARIARAQGQVTRWLALPPAGEGSPSGDVVKRLRTLTSMLDTGWRTASLRADAERQARGATTLRQLILDLLEPGPLRPSQIARRVGRDPAQVSRALSALVDSGDLRRSVPDGQDHRAVSYSRKRSAQPALVA